MIGIMDSSTAIVIVPLLMFGSSLVEELHEKRLNIESKNR
jgi:hypothetical protein